MKTKYVYPAVFQPEEEGYSVHFPDLPGCVTEGDTMEETLDMARDALGLYLSVLTDSGDPIPAASNPADLCLEGKGFVALVDMDMVIYMQRHGTRSVKKTLTIPQWLNTLAERQGVNFSGVLQSALIDRLEIHRERKNQVKRKI